MDKQVIMIRLFLCLLFVALSATVRAQVATQSTTLPTSDPSSVSAASLEIETRARDEEFANWKIRYASNRSAIANQIRDVRQMLGPFSKTHPERGRELTDLLNGSINNWNKDKIDYGDPEQFALCRELLTNIRKAVQTGTAKK